MPEPILEILNSFFFIAIIVVDLLTILHILYYRHSESTSAAFWILLVSFFHTFGVIWYLIFGMSRMHSFKFKMSNKNRDMLGRRPIESKYDDFIAEHSTHSKNSALENILAHIFPDNTMIHGNKLNILCDGTAAYPEMLDAIKSAKHFICMQSYIIMNDSQGKLIMGALKERADAGVKVRVIYDRLGSGVIFSSLFFKSIIKRHVNFKLRSFSRINFFRPWGVQLRNHRKLLIIDGKTAFVGGINISEDNDATINRQRFIHDLHCQVSGPVVAALQNSFSMDWGYVADDDPISDYKFCPLPEPVADGNIQIFSSGPGQGDGVSGKLFTSVIAASSKRLWIISPYFTPPIELVSHLKMAVARGVEVRVIMPEKSDHWFVTMASYSVIEQLLAANISVYLRKGPFCHIKAAIMDDYGVMGSSNWDSRSFWLNFELDFISDDETFVDQLAEQFLFEENQSQKLDLVSWKKRPISQKLLEGACSLLKPVL